MKYDFVCNECYKTFEVEVIGISKLEVRRSIVQKCPYCKSKNTRKLLTAPAIVFRGKGFYKNDK